MSIFEALRGQVASFWGQKMKIYSLICHKLVLTQFWPKIVSWKFEKNHWWTQKFESKSSFRKCVQADIILSFYCCSAASLFPCCFNVIPTREYAKAQTSHVTQELLCIADPKANFLRGIVFMNYLLQQLILRARKNFFVTEGNQMWQIGLFLLSLWSIRYWVLNPNDHFLTVSTFQPIAF